MRESLTFNFFYLVSFSYIIARGEFSFLFVFFIAQSLDLNTHNNYVSIRYMTIDNDLMEEKCSAICKAEQQNFN